MTVFDWSPVRRALAQCRRANIAVPVWWRDDDAIEMTSALAQLTKMSERTRVPVHLAIIPAHVHPGLREAIDPECIFPVVHGWAHADHSVPGTKKNEFLTDRPDALREAQAGLDKMVDLFGADLRRMFVPPWNRINPNVTQGLAEQGYEVLSTYRPRSSPTTAGVSIVNTHVDPIWWSGTRDLVEPDVLIAGIATQLTDRAEGRADHTEPFGLLTHHLVHSPEIWSFTEAFWNEMRSGGSIPWTMENGK